MYRYITLYILWYSIFIVYTLLALYICCTPCRILACWLMLSVLHTTLNKDYSILFYSIRWIPRTNGQWRGKCFHLMKSWCNRQCELLILAICNLQATLCHFTTVVDPNHLVKKLYTMRSSNGNIFRVTGPLCGEFTGTLTKAGDAELWCFPSSTPE